MTTLERMARVQFECGACDSTDAEEITGGYKCARCGWIPDDCTCYEVTGGHQPGCPYHHQRALAVLREEQAPCIAFAPNAEYIATVKARIEAPPSPCATCGGALAVETVEATERGHFVRVDPCPDCRPDAGK